MSDCVRLALIGIGHVAEYQLQALAQLAGWELVGGADIRAERKTLLPDGVQFCSSTEELVARCDADIFLVSTPSDSHYSVARTVIGAGRNLLVEKPCCATNEQLDGLLEASMDRRVYISALLHAAHAGEVEWFATRGPELGFGPIGSFSCFFSDPYEVDGVMAPAAESLGGAWLDSGINALSVIGRFVNPSSLTTTEFQYNEVGGPKKYVSYARAIYRFDTPEGSGTGEITTTWEQSLNRKTTTLRYPESNTTVLLDHSLERVEITRDGTLVSSESFSNGQQRLVNHYTRLFEDAHSRFLRRDSNLEHAARLHRLLFSADGARTVGGGACH